jgi:hypothetical protein
MSMLMMLFVPLDKSVLIQPKSIEIAHQRKKERLKVEVQELLAQEYGARFSTEIYTR